MENYSGIVKSATFGTNHARVVMACSYGRRTAPLPAVADPITEYQFLIDQVSYH